MTVTCTDLLSLCPIDRRAIHIDIEDLWPSQLHIVDRIFQDPRDLVVALPASAGKTRIVELSTLTCLEQDRRTVYVTPLRALSAQNRSGLACTRVTICMGNIHQSLTGVSLASVEPRN